MTEENTIKVTKEQDGEQNKEELSYEEVLQECALIQAGVISDMGAHASSYPHTITLAGIMYAQQRLEAEMDQDEIDAAKQLAEILKEKGEQYLPRHGWNV